jgi:hypothetical protein
MFIIIEFEEMWVETKNSHVKSDDKKIQRLSSYKGYGEKGQSERRGGMGTLEYPTSSPYEI